MSAKDEELTPILIVRTAHLHGHRLFFLTNFQGTISSRASAEYKKNKSHVLTPSLKYQTQRRRNLSSFID